MKTGLPNPQCGFSYIEVLVATVLIVTALIPAMDALHNGVNASAVYKQRVVAHYRLSSLMEEVLSEPFATLDAAATSAGGPGVATSYSDPSGTTDRRIVYLSRYDGDNADSDNDPFTGIDADLLWVSVGYENSKDWLDTLVAR